MSSPNAPSAGESTEQSLGAVIKYLPAFQELLNKNLKPTAEAEYGVAETVSPKYQKLMTDLYARYGPELARIGADVDRISRTEGARTDAALVEGPGRDLARAYDKTDRELNPEYYNIRSQAGSSLGQLLSGINIDDAGPEAERLINQENIRSGTAAAPSATTTVGNALQFGNERIKRMGVLSNAIAQANQYMPAAQNQGFNSATAILNRPTSNTGQAQFGGVQQGAGSSANATGQGLFNNVAGFQNNAAQINANRRDVLDRLNETTSSL